MTFDTRERSLASGQPVRLYEFRRGTLAWRFCSADRTITFQGAPWKSAPISDDGVRLTGEASADLLTITGPASLEVAQLFRFAPPSAEISVTVRDMHYGEADAATSAQVVWVGSITGVRWPQADRSAIACQSISASMDRPGLRLTWERSCPHTIYDRRCGVDRNAFAVNATVQGLTGAAVTAAALATYADGYFAGGFLAWAVGGGETELRGIEAHTGSQVQVMGGTQGLVLAQVVTAYPGCRQTMDYCNGTFGNRPNYGGVRHLPGKSPFDGSPVF